MYIETIEQADYMLELAIKKRDDAYAALVQSRINLRRFMRIDASNDDLTNAYEILADSLERWMARRDVAITIMHVRNMLIINV